VGVGSGGAAAWLQPSSKLKLKKKPDFEDTTISNVLRGLPSNQNHPLKSADE